MCAIVTVFVTIYVYRVSFDSVRILQQCKINSGLFPMCIISTFTICNICLCESYNVYLDTH